MNMLLEINESFINYYKDDATKRPLAGSILKDTTLCTVALYTLFSFHLWAKNGKFDSSRVQLLVHWDAIRLFQTS